MKTRNTIRPTGCASLLLFVISAACGDDSSALSRPSEAGAGAEAASGSRANSATAGPDSAPETRLAADSDVTLFLYTEPNFGGTRKNVILNECAEEDQFVSASLKAAPGYVCFAYAGPSCTDQCEMCVDDAGWPSTDAFNRLFVSGRCERADAAKCQNADCTFK